MYDDFVSADATPLFREETGDAKHGDLLWGDGVHVLGGDAGRRRVRARGREGWVRRDALGGTSLLELYLIDVGQGDGVLLKTPDFRHVVIDGGFPRAFQDTGRNAADFVDWKFARDYGRRVLEIDALVCSRCDADHYGALLDLLDAAALDDLDAAGVRVERFLHTGLGWWTGPGGRRGLGPSTQVGGRAFWTRLLEGRDSLARAVGAAETTGSEPRAHGLWADFLRAVLATRRRSGQPTAIQRLSHADRHVPGFAPGDGDGTSIRVLGPVQVDVAGRPGLRQLAGGASRNTGGARLLLRVDHGHARVLLAGDLDRASQAALLEDSAAREELACDVARVCHHAGDDLSPELVRAMGPSATVIATGEHERSVVARTARIAASAAASAMGAEDEHAPRRPLVYATELDRSAAPRAGGDARTSRLRRTVLHRNVSPHTSVRTSVARSSGALAYGLVNVRTDGERILCATLDETDPSWRIQTFKARF